MRYLLILTACVLICACNEEEPKYSVVRVTFEIRNLSSQDVELFLYNRVNQLKINESIASMDSAIVEEGFIHPAPGGPTYLLTTSNLDSAVIAFEDGKKLVQTRPSREKNDTINNILFDSSYVIYDEEGRLQYTLTQEDYERAK